MIDPICKHCINFRENSKDSFFFLKGQNFLKIRVMFIMTTSQTDRSLRTHVKSLQKVLLSWFQERFYLSGLSPKADAVALCHSCYFEAW